MSAKAKGAPPGGRVASSASPAFRRAMTEELINAHAGLGDRDRALAWLERGYASHSPGLVNLAADPRLDDLRSDSRFVSLMDRMRL